MTSTANDTQQNPPAEQPLTWTSSKVFGFVGLTHDATAEINNETWTFRVDSPSKGLWVARVWRDGVASLYREDRTMKGAKQQAQSQANSAAKSTCPECRKIDGHILACPVYIEQSAAKDRARGTKLGLRTEMYEVQDETVIVLKDEEAERLAGSDALELGPDILKKLDPAGAQQLMAELEETFPHLAEWKAHALGGRLKSVGLKMGQVAETLASDMTPAVVSAAESMARMNSAIKLVQSARDRVQMRKDTCGCRTPLHTMRCGVGGRVRVTRSAVSA